MSEDCIGKGITDVLLCSITSSPPLFSIFSLWNICVCFVYCLLWLCPSWVPHLSAMLYAAQESTRGEYSSSQTSGFWECAKDEWTTQVIFSLTHAWKRNCHLMRLDYSGTWKRSKMETEQPLWATFFLCLTSIFIRTSYQKINFQTLCGYVFSTTISHKLSYQPRWSIPNFTRLQAMSLFYSHNNRPVILSLMLWASNPANTQQLAPHICARRNEVASFSNWLTKVIFKEWPRWILTEESNK